MNKIIPKFSAVKSGTGVQYKRGEKTRMTAYLSTLKEGAELYLYCEPVSARRLRSDQQNRYYWGVVMQYLSQWCGYTPEEMHEAMKMKFLIVHRDKLPDTVRSTRSLTKDEMVEYIDNVIMFAAENGVVIPDANQIVI